MSHSPATSPSRWVISSRQDGDVLAAHARGEGVELLLLARAVGHDANQIQSWLAELIGVAVETSRNDPGDRPITALLRHALTGLLFSHAELWHQTPADPPCSIAFVTTRYHTAFGWAGPAKVETWVDGQPADGPWIRVRDPDGNEAQAIEVESWHRMRVHVSWQVGESIGEPGAAEVTGEWAGSARVREAPRATTEEDPLSQWRAPSWLRTPGPAAPELAPTPPPVSPPVDPAPRGAQAAPPPAPPRAPAPTIPFVETSPAGGAPAPAAPERKSWMPDPPVLPPAEEVSAPPPPAAPERKSWMPEPPDLPPAEVPAPAPVAPERKSWMPEPPVLPPSGAPVPPPAATPTVPIAETAAGYSPPRIGARAEPPPLTVESEQDRIAALSPDAATSSAPPPVFPVDPVPELIATPPRVPAVPPGPPPPLIESAEDRLAALSPDVESAPAPDLAPPAASPLAAMVGFPPTPVDPPDHRPGGAPSRSLVGDFVPEQADHPSGGAPVSTPAELELPATAPPVLTPPVLRPPPAPALPEVADRFDAPPPPEPRLETTALAAAAADPQIFMNPEVRTPISRRERALRRQVRHPEWPGATDEVSVGARLARHWPSAAAVLALFVVGWLLGALPAGRGRNDKSWATRALARVGFGAPSFQLLVDSHPQGSWIWLDGKDTGRRTPAVLEAAPGSHVVTLTVAQLGSARYRVHGARRERVTLDAELWGTLAVTSSDRTAAVKVTLDDQPRGLAPLMVDSLAPGVHRVQFWSPGAGSWDQIVEVRVRDTSRVVARPIASPATGVIEVRANSTQGGETTAISGATVWLDGAVRGVTPLKLELPRGPHSARVSYQGQDSPVQVVDLPGGNQRFATFELSLDPERPRLAAAPLGRVVAEPPTVVSATIEHMDAPEVREMWLHVSSPEGSWRRFPMTVSHAAEGAVGTVEFPIRQLDGRGRARLYVSVTNHSGDEYFSEIQSVTGPVGGTLPAEGP